ncbi:hypothetical protein BSR04_02995 [Serratia plymuthica]|nr:hypothetical protein BSR04_02995 [Serratia plymuthica]
MTFLLIITVPRIYQSEQKLNLRWHPKPDLKSIVHKLTALRTEKCFFQIFSASDYAFSRVKNYEFRMKNPISDFKLLTMSSATM